MDNFENDDRITILDHCHCIVCDKPIIGRRRRCKKVNQDGLIETHFKLTHPFC